MTEAATRNLRRLLDREPTAGDDGPRWSHAGPEFDLGRRPYARRLVLATVRRYGMTGGWYSALTDVEIRSLEDLKGIGRTIVQKSLCEEEQAGRIVRLARAELIAWLESIDRADLADLPKAKRFIVDLRPLAELLGRELAPLAPSTVHLPRRRWPEPAFAGHACAAEEAEAGDACAAEEATEAGSLACARDSALVLSVRSEVEVLPLTPSEPEIETEDPEVRLLWRLLKTGTFAQRCEAQHKLETRGLLAPAPELEPVSPPPAPAPSADAPRETEPAAKQGQRYPTGFSDTAKRLVGLLAEPDTRAAVSQRLYAHLAGPFGVADNPESMSPEIWPARFEWLGGREVCRVGLAELIANTVRSRVSSPERYFSAGLGKLSSLARELEAQKPTPAHTRQSLAGVGRTADVSVMTNRTGRPSL